MLTGNWGFCSEYNVKTSGNCLQPAGNYKKNFNSSLLQVKNRRRTEKEEEIENRKKSRKHKTNREESTRSAAQTISATFFFEASNASFALDSARPAPIAIFKAVSSVIRFSGHAYQYLQQELLRIRGRVLQHARLSCCVRSLL